MDQRFVTHAAVRHGRLGFFKAWHHRCKRTQATHTAHLVKLRAQVVHVELTLGELLRHCLRSEEHTSELQSLMRISYAVFCLKKKKNTINTSELIDIVHT